MIETAQRDGITIMTMMHGKANTLDSEFCEALAAAFERERDSRAVVLTGQGRIFSAGVDLLRATDGGADYLRAFLPALHRLYDTVFNFPRPVIAAVNGHAIAGGCVLACCADRRLMMRDSGRIGVTELLVGVPFPALAFEIMRSVVPNRFFPDTVLSGATFTPEVAVGLGLIDEVAPPADFLSRPLAAAQMLAALSPETFAMTKRQIRQPVTERLARDGARIEAEVTAIWTKPETLARIRDYVARTLKKG